IGFTGTSHGVLTGGAGLELQHNALLAGRSGSEQVQIGTDGQQIPLAGSHNQPVVNGSSLRLTIVPALQYAAEQACANQVKKTKADNCTVVIINPKTGAVLAMAQYPTYNPSDVTNVDQTTNLAVQAQFQPGSTAKVITASAALERGGQTPMSAYKVAYQSANGGVRVRPTLIEGTTNSAGTYTPASPSPSHRVIQAKTANELLRILQQVPGIDAEGAQPWGVIPGYAVAAKTGTSQESNGKCALCIYGSSWIGMAPGDKPQLVVSVTVQHPRKGGHFGAVVAGPVFYQVMKDALATLQ